MSWSKVEARRSSSSREELLTEDEVAQWLRVTPRMVRRLRAERRLKYLKVGRYVRFRPADVEEYLQFNEREAPSWVSQRASAGLGHSS
jgi:excisionase family DNA binding protein